MKDYCIDSTALWTMSTRRTFIAYAIVGGASISCGRPWIFVIAAKWIKAADDLIKYTISLV